MLKLDAVDLEKMFLLHKVNFNFVLSISIIGGKMSRYHLKNGRKYKKRRALVVAATVLSIVAIVMAVYLFLNRDNVTGASKAGDSTHTGSSQTAATQTGPGTAANSAATNSGSAGSTGQPSDSTANGSNSDLNGVTTQAHGYLPKIGTAAKSGRMDELKKIITDYTSKLPGRYGVTYIDLATGEMVNVNDQIEYIAASTSKLPINMVLFKDIEAGKVSLEDKLVYKEEDLEYGTGIIQNSPYGTEYTVRETSKLAIRKSDNCGVNMIIRQVGIENVRKYLTDLGGKVYYGKTHRSCPYDMALVARDMYSHYLDNEAVYGELIDNLENTDWNDRISAKLTGVKVAHKIGNQTKTANDVGIVFGKHPYVLSVMTEDVDFGTACNNIAALSKKIFDFEEAYAAETPVQAK